ncbi:MAG: DUF4294 domain-containing protein [Chitinophagales bacterium]
MKRLVLFLSILLCTPYLHAQEGVVNDSSATLADSTITLPDVPVIRFKSKEDEMEFYKDVQRIRKVLPYVKIAKRMYVTVMEHKENEKRGAYRHYRKDLEKEMREKFEAELRDLSINQGKVLVKLVNRETGNNCYQIIKDVKGGFSAWVWQLIAKKYDYNLKEVYDPKKERILEMAIRALGSEYDPN